MDVSNYGLFGGWTCTLECWWRRCYQAEDDDLHEAVGVIFTYATVVNLQMLMFDNVPLHNWSIRNPTGDALATTQSNSHSLSFLSAQQNDIMIY